MLLMHEWFGPHLYRTLQGYLRYWPVLICAGVCGWIGTSVSRRIALLYDIVDRPDHLVKTHAQPVPYLGGVGIFVGTAVGILVGMAILSFRSLQADPFRDLMAMVIGGALALVVGVTDDIHNLKPQQKIFGQILAASILVLAGWWPHLDGVFAMIGWSLHPHWITLIEIMMVFLVVLVTTNSLNLLDGIDGLCGGVTLLMALGMLFLIVQTSTWSIKPGNDPVGLILALALIGSLLGFLRFNRPPARIFMGDGGSLLLGFLVAALILRFFQTSIQTGLASLMMAGLPLLDTSVAVVRRKLHGRPLFTSDRGHLYDQMMDRGLSLGKTLICCYTWTALYIAVGVVVVILTPRLIALLYGGVIVLSWVAVWLKGYLRREALHATVVNSVETEHAG